MATVGKKFTSPEKWEAAWFSRLSPGEKLLYYYLWDRCDHAGVIEFLPAIWGAHIGQSIDEQSLDDLMDAVNSEQDRILKIDEKVWLVGYISYQQQKKKGAPVKAGHPMLPKIVDLLKGHSLFDVFVKRYPALLSGYLAENSDSGTLKPTPSLIQGLGVSLSRSKSQISSSSSSNSGSGSGSPSGKDSAKAHTQVNQNTPKGKGTSEPPATTDWKQIATAAVECLKIFPSTSGDIQFMEEEQAKKIIRGAVIDGVPIDEAVTELKGYLKSQKSKVMQTGEEYDLLEILENF